MKEKSCDILVLGGGGSGLVAAVRAAEHGGGKVIVLEKGKVTGGGMLFASTMRTFRSRWQVERNIPDQSGDFIRRGMDETFWRLDPELVREAVLGTGRFFDWYSGYESPEVLERYQARPYVFDIPVNGQPGPQIDGFHNGSGRVIMEAMVRWAGELGVEILTGHRAVTAEVKDGRITAVLAETAEGRVRVACRSCILATGSWIRNREVVGRVLPEYLEADVAPNAHQNPNYTGDGLAIAQAAGAFIDWDSFCLRLMGPICGLGEQSPLDALTHGSAVVLVDETGRRFAAEPLVPRMDPFDTGHVLLRLPRAKSFFLFSADTLEKIIADSQSGSQGGPFGMPALPPLAEVEGWFRQAAEKSPEAAWGNTLEELAERLGLSADNLCATVEEYNASCDQGEDWHFFKEPAGLIPLRRGPFYAVSGKLSTDGAFGGVRVDAGMHAYREGGGIVEGLYVTGDFASGRHIVLGGVKRQVLNDMSWALSSGFLAGTRAAEELA